MRGFVTTKRSISTVFLVVLLVVVLLTSVLWKSSEAAAKTALLQVGNTVQERVDFIHRLGYTVSLDVPEKAKQIEIPHIFSDVYQSYQELQQKAGYDLTAYTGKVATLYTFKLVDAVRNDVYAHLIVYDGRIIGGDIAALSVSDGYLRPLQPL